MVQSVASKEPSNISFHVGGYKYLKIVENLNEVARLYIILLLQCCLAEEKVKMQFQDSHHKKN